jgi:hypothetical protein
MNACNFENIGFQNLQYPAKVFITSIRNSSFHWHYEYECISVLKGSVTVSMNLKPFLMKKNDIIFLNSKSIHEINSTSEPNICMILQLDPSLFICEKRSRFFYTFPADRLPERCTTSPSNTSTEASAPHTLIR